MKLHVFSLRFTFLQHRYDSYKCSADSARIVRIRPYTKKYWEIRYELNKNTPKATTNHVRKKGYSWQLFTIGEIFSLR